MILFRVDGHEQTQIPSGIQSGGPSGPLAPPQGYPHKVEWMDTSAAKPEWKLLCENRREFDKELANFLHGRLCHFNHVDQCGYHDTNEWLSGTKRRYLDSACTLLRFIEHKTGLRDAQAVQFVKDFYAAVQVA